MVEVWWGKNSDAWLSLFTHFRRRRGEKLHGRGSQHVWWDSAWFNGDSGVFKRSSSHSENKTEQKNDLLSTISLHLLFTVQPKQINSNDLNETKKTFLPHGRKKWNQNQFPLFHFQGRSISEAEPVAPLCVRQRFPSSLSELGKTLIRYLLAASMDSRSSHYGWIMSGMDGRAVTSIPTYPSVHLGNRKKKKAAQWFVPLIILISL